MNYDEFVIIYVQLMDLKFCALWLKLINSNILKVKNIKLFKNLLLVEMLNLWVKWGKNSQMCTKHNDCVFLYIGSVMVVILW
jgi:hypothetical protein